NSNKNVIETYSLLESVYGHDIIIPYIKDEKSEFNGIVEEKYKKAYERLGKSPEPIEDTKVVDLFKKFGPRNETAILLSVSGGAMAEGVDYVGNQMEMVISVGLPYPSSASERELNDAKKNYFTMMTKDPSLGEDLAFKQDTFRKTAQTIGRANRKLSDRSVVICADERLLGVKGDGTGYSFGYELLNKNNTRKNLSILQRPLQTYNRVVIPDNLPENTQRLIEKYSRLKERISFYDMAQKIREFYAK
ncbi:MAG: helicase C-terminal domain-containing protein, partial [Nanoarchaeota archaeon]